MVTFLKHDPHIVYNNIVASEIFSFCASNSCNSKILAVCVGVIQFVSLKNYLKNTYIMTI